MARARTTDSPTAARPRALWWRDAVIYQVYIRSFADGDGDGFGDITGLRSRLPYLAGLGVDALWLNPWYPSPMADGGYDVADYRDIDPVFGTLDQARALLDDAHELGLRILVDIVPNHTSSAHAWFREALAEGPSSPARDRYIFRPGRGPDGDLPPNDWRSVFGGPAWTRVREPDGTPGPWYLHLFAPEQPDLNWDNEEVHAEFESILRFWFDHGVDGVRIDVAHGLVKAPGLPDLGSLEGMLVDGADADVDHPHWDREEVHAIFQGWRAVADAYDDPRVFVAEAWAPPERLARYVRSDELHTAFNFDYLMSPWRADHLRRVIDESLTALEGAGAPATWVLSNHDVARHVSRYARPQPDGRLRSLADLVQPADRELGIRRARAAALLTLALPGGVYIYQGEELGLWEVEDLPEDALQDPQWERSGRTDRGRDGCRVPLPWSGDRPPFGYSPDGSRKPWLPQPLEWKSLTAEAQEGDPGSMLSLYRTALRVRRSQPALGDGTLAWDSAPGGEVLSFRRAPGFACVVNLSGEPVPLPAHREVLLASGELDGELLPSDTAVWLAG